MRSDIIPAPDKVDRENVKYSLSEIWEENKYNNRQRLYLSIACLFDCSGRHLEHDTLQDISAVRDDTGDQAISEYWESLLEIKKTGAVREKNQLLELVTWPRRQQTILPRKFVRKCLEVIGEDDFKNVYNFVTAVEDKKTEQVINMPEIARFYGIVIKLFFGDHPPPHFHAVYDEYVGLFNIDTLEMIEGDLPKRAKQLVIEWAKVNQDKMKHMWDNQEFHKLPPLE